MIQPSRLKKYAWSFNVSTAYHWGNEIVHTRQLKHLVNTHKMLQLVSQRDMSVTDYGQCRRGVGEEAGGRKSFATFLCIETNASQKGLLRTVNCSQNLN
jgi:hypothetical protein